MNLQPFYELRERLLVSAAAGTQLVQEDFRLREAAKKTEVFAKASPVFAKISQMTGQLIEAPREAKAEILLDLMGLLDAFLTTQGVSQVDGELLPAVDEEHAYSQKECGQTLYQDIPYSRLQPIKWALTETGSGRQSTLEEHYRQEPELFADFRIRPLLVKALGDGYAEIADMICDWIVKLGEPMLPLLKAGFLPKGKKDMVRRVQAIMEIAGEKENDFYREQLKESEKEVRESLIRALRLSQENRQLLFDLLKTEKGKMKTTVMWSLGFMEGEDAAQFWSKQAEKKPEETALLLKDSSTSYSSVLLAKIVEQEWEKQLEKNRERNDKSKLEGRDESKEAKRARAVQAKQEHEKFRDLIYACFGKLGKDIRRMLERTAKEEEIKNFRVDFASMMEETIVETLPESEEAKAYYQLAQRLFLEVGREYARPAFAAALLTKPAAQVYDEFCGGMDKGLGFSLFRVLQKIAYQDGVGYYIQKKVKINERGERIVREIRPLEDFDMRWYALIIEKRAACPDDSPQSGTSLKGADAVLYHLIRRDNPELCQMYGKYFYHRAMSGSPNVGMVQMLKMCGWTDFDGMLVRFMQTRESAWTYYLREFVVNLPVSREQLLKELEMVQNKYITKNTAPATVRCIQKWLEQLRDGASPEELAY